MATIQDLVQKPSATMDSWGFPQQQARLKVIQLIAHAEITLDQAVKIVKECRLRHLRCGERTALHVITRMDYTKSLGNIAKAVFIDDAELYQQNDSKDRSCLHLAAELGSEKWIDFFLKRKVKKDLKTAAGDTPLHSACKGPAITEIIISKFSNLCDAPNKRLQTPLHFLASNTQIKNKKTHIQCVNRLKYDESAPIARDSENRTPLHMAVISGRHYLLDILNTKDVDYLELAKLAKEPKTIKWCLEKYNPGQTLFNIALENGMDAQATALYNGETMPEKTLIEAVDKGMKALTLAFLNAQAYSVNAYHGAARHGWCDVLKRLEAIRWQQMPWYERIAENACWAFGRSPCWDVPVNGKRPLDLATDEPTRDYLKSLGCKDDLGDGWHMVNSDNADEGWEQI